MKISLDKLTWTQALFVFLVERKVLVHITNGNLYTRDAITNIVTLAKDSKSVLREIYAAHGELVEKGWKFERQLHRAKYTSRNAKRKLKFFANQASQAIVFAFIAELGYNDFTIPEMLK